MGLQPNLFKGHISIMEKLESPCTSVCRISHETGFCEGCFRTRDEIGQWRDLSFQEQKMLIEKLHDRRLLTTGQLKRRLRNRIQH